MAKIASNKINLKVVFNDKDQLTGKIKTRSILVKDINAQANDDDIYSMADTLAKMQKYELKEILKLEHSVLEV
ncbi:hypothetical protein [Peptostreptococcus equinus]|uniref:DUF1659 domain-containing protein n=1 Tax=Peptostreptococcus equinus TaxID=3003601 RepID=A0ABY7JMK1_9FIRM|nr:hypothetical protein [Peptostreptococcus sp. CBA3647]WAW14389.1 hypothetical protein O0R46_07215 [Peptostreptococcus sp. CBA3647]